MLRPCYLVLDREFSGSISTRKLVIETAKFNVITAYSASEAIETLKAFPGVHGAVIDQHIDDTPCSEIAAELKRIRPDLVVIAIGIEGQCGSADYHVEPFSPDKLLELLRQINPAETAVIKATDLALSRAESKE